MSQTCPFPRPQDMRNYTSTGRPYNSRNHSICQHKGSTLFAHCPLEQGRPSPIPNVSSHTQRLMRCLAMRSSTFRDSWQYARAHRLPSHYHGSQPSTPAHNSCSACHTSAVLLASRSQICTCTNTTGPSTGSLMPPGTQLPAGIKRHTRCHMKAATKTPLTTRN